jgi:hypothetical protein
MEGKMFPERDPEVEVRKLREYREMCSRRDTQMLMYSWRAIARSHRSLDKEVYRLEKGELHVSEGRRRLSE